MSDSTRKPGEQAEPPTGLCETCVHMKPMFKNSKPEHFMCHRNTKTEPVDPVLRFISSDIAQPKASEPEFCTHIRERCGEVCPDHREKARDVDVEMAALNGPEVVVDEPDEENDR